MNDDLAQRFEDFLRGTCPAAAFEDELLALCRATPKRAWEVLALLDQYYRRHKISDELCRRLRRAIGRQAMRLEGHTVEPDIEPEDRRQAGPRTAETSEPSHPSRIRWRRGFQTSPAFGLIAVVLGVAGSTTVQHTPRLSLADDVAPAAPEPTPASASVSASDRGPGVISLSSDRYLVRPRQKALVFTVERSTDGGADAGFIWWTQPAGARSSADYIGTRAKPAAVPEGAASTSLQVPIVANPRRRHIEMFYVVIGKADGGAELGPIHRAAVFIIPDDKP